MLALVLQLLFIILFGVFVRYPEMGTPLAADEVNKTDSERHGAASKLEVGQSYPCKSRSLDARFGNTVLDKRNVTYICLFGSDVNK